MAFEPLTAILDVGGKIIDKIFPDKTEAEKAKAKLIELQIQGELHLATQSFEVAIAEAKSADKWTSRARPSFFYVMYIMILFSLPMGILSVFSPNAATQISGGMKAFLGAIPDALWAVFGAGFSVYTVSRSVWDKKK